MADLTSESLAAIFSETIWVGIKDKQTLASIGIATSIESASYIMFIATDKKYQNKGYATSIVSTLVMEFLKKSHTTIIYVISNNKPVYINVILESNGNKRDHFTKKKWYADYIFS